MLLATLSSTEVVVILTISLLMPILVGLLFYYIYQQQVNSVYKTQRLLTDRELLLLMDAQPDGMMTVKRLAAISNLSTNQAKSRLSYLNRRGIFQYATDSRFRLHYSLREPLDHRNPPATSPEPFLTVEDILTLFKFYDYKLTYQKIAFSTGLPVPVIKQEIDYFIRQKIIEKVTSRIHGSFPVHTFLLREPYRSNPDKFLEMEVQANLELKKIYVKEMRL